MIILIGFLALLLRLYRLREVPALSTVIYGPSEYSVKLAAAIFGAFNVVLIYFAVKKIFKNFKNKELLALLVGLFMTFSPWGYYYSRVVSIVNIFLFLVLLAIIISFKRGKQIPVIKRLMTSTVILALAVVCLTNTRIFLGRYLYFFSLRFLFFEGNWPNFLRGMPVGQLNHLDIILLPLGIYYLISRQIRGRKFVCFFLLVSPLPGLLNKGSALLEKSFLMLIPLTIISAFGMIFIWEKVRRARRPIAYLISLTLIAIYLYSFVFYLDQFFVHAPIKYLPFLP